MITLAKWPDNADQVLGIAIVVECMELAKNQVEQGICQLWHCVDTGLEAWILTRVYLEDRCWLCVAYQGNGIAHFLPAFAVAAQARGLVIKYTSPRNKFMARLLKRFHYIYIDEVQRYA